jgi:hypothetical protein
MTTTPDALSAARLLSGAPPDLLTGCAEGAGCRAIGRLDRSGFDQPSTGGPLPRGNAPTRSGALNFTLTEEET